MQSQQREHIDTVIEVAANGIGTPKAIAHDEIIRASWSRCVHEHRLDPTRMQEPVILPSTLLREHQDRIEEFLHIARHGVETLYQQVAGLGYCVLLTDARGVTVDFLGDLVFEPSLRKAGLYLGADWSESRAGTCGVGTCIATGEALTVHLDDHFDATHIPLSCTVAPVYNAQGTLNAVLDISRLTSPQPKESQHLALQLVKMYAHHVENASFLHSFRRDWVLRLSAVPQFLEVNPEYLLAIDAGGCVIGHNRRAQLLLEAQWKKSVIGLPFERLFNSSINDFGRFTQGRAPDQRAVTVAGSGQVLFMLASPAPPRYGVPREAVPDRKVPSPLAALSGGDPALDRQIERAARLVNTPVSMLLTGETGSGKEYFAKAVHRSSERRSRPFIAVNCAAIPETLIESELFGHLPGSFSGASPKGKRGLIQEADTGTLFLDEIGDMPRDLQARLLRVLAEREVLPIGATKPVPVNIRVIAATHCDLEALVREGRFRDDLYYRLNGAHIVLPPLRERRDLAWLIQRMLSAQGDGSETAKSFTLSPEASEWLHAHRWPGNLRELCNVIEFARAVCTGGLIEIDDLPDHLLRAEAPRVNAGAGAPTASQPLSPDAALLLQYLRAARWNVSAVARQLGITRMTLYRRMERYGIESPNQMQGTPD